MFTTNLLNILEAHNVQNVWNAATDKATMEDIWKDHQAMLELQNLLSNLFDASIAVTSNETFVHVNLADKQDITVSAYGKVTVDDKEYNCSYEEYAGVTAVLAEDEPVILLPSVNFTWR